MTTLVLRTFYIDPRVDEELKYESFTTGIPKNDLFRKYINLGRRLERERLAREAKNRKTRTR